jgi:hypothetical protein
MGVTNRTELFAQRIATLEAEVTAAQRGWSNLSTLRTSPAIREVYPSSLLYKVPQRLWGNYVVECDMCNNEVDPRIPVCKWCRVGFCSEVCALRHAKVYEQIPNEVKWGRSLKQIRVIYCPMCATEFPTEDYTKLKVCYCKTCGASFEIIEQPRTKWILADD